MSTEVEQTLFYQMRLFLKDNTDWFNQADTNEDGKLINYEFSQYMLDNFNGWSGVEDNQKVDLINDFWKQFDENRSASYIKDENGKNTNLRNINALDATEQANMNNKIAETKHYTISGWDDNEIIKSGMAMLGEGEHTISPKVVADDDQQEAEFTLSLIKGSSDGVSCDGKSVTIPDKAGKYTFTVVFKVGDTIIAQKTNQVIVKDKYSFVDKNGKEFGAEDVVMNERTSQNLNIKVYDNKNKTAMDPQPTITYTYDNTYMTIDETGKITTKDVEENQTVSVKASVTIDDKTYTTTFKVTIKEIDGVDDKTDDTGYTLSANSMTVEEGKTGEITPTVKDNNGENVTVTDCKYTLADNLSGLTISNNGIALVVDATNVSIEKDTNVTVNVVATTKDGNTVKGTITVKIENDTTKDNKSEYTLLDLDKIPAYGWGGNSEHLEIYGVNDSLNGKQVTDASFADLYNNNAVIMLHHDKHTDSENNRNNDKETVKERIEELCGYIKNALQSQGLDDAILTQASANVAKRYIDNLNITADGSGGSFIARGSYGGFDEETEVADKIQSYSSYQNGIYAACNVHPGIMNWVNEYAYAVSFKGLTDDILTEYNSLARNDDDDTNNQYYAASDKSIAKEFTSRASSGEDIQKIVNELDSLDSSSGVTYSLKYTYYANRESESYGYLGISVDGKLVRGTSVAYKEGITGKSVEYIQDRYEDPIDYSQSSSS